MTPETTVRIDSGSLEGVVRDGIVSYLGIPYAAPPVGDLRWRPSRPVAPWPETMIADRYGPDSTSSRRRS